MLAMKRLLTLFNCVMLLTILLGADVRTSAEQAPIAAPPKQPCAGYTIIEFGKGIDCNGDTVKLVKIRGGIQMASRE